MKIKKIYCDMDGVLTDFERGFKKATGKSIEEYEAEHGKNSFWSEIDRIGYKFWSELEWMPEGEKLWSYIKSKNVPIEILTSPSRDYSSRVGKKIWVKENLGDSIIVNFSWHKSSFSKPGNVLIDDYTKHQEKWIKKGGIFILYTGFNNLASEL